MSLLSPNRMSSTTQKHRDFVSEPIGEKPVTELPGIGNTLGRQLTVEGFDKAYMVLGQYLVLKKNKENFKTWLNETCRADARWQQQCYEGLKEWCKAFL